MDYSIVKYGDPDLRERAVPVERVDEAIRELAGDMLRAMHKAEGLGLAAEQVGRTESICVIDVPAALDVDGETGERENPDVEMPLVLINPELVSTRGTETREEGCLSFPDIAAKITRAWEVTVRALDLDGISRERVLRGLPARAAQHELDHLSGVLIVDRMSPVRKVSLAGKLKKLKRETKARLVG